VSDLSEVGVVVPTLGTRINYLVQCLKSIRAAGCINIYLVGPINVLQNKQELMGLYDCLIDDPKSGLTGAINTGVKSFPGFIRYVTWLGDDDLLTKDSLTDSLLAFDADANVVATYGMCDYISSDGSRIFQNKSGNWASILMNFLPNLIPQPGSLLSRLAFEKIDGVKSSYPLAFDFEMFFELKKIGKLQYIPKVQGAFRWHPDSMSVDQRKQAVQQSSQIRNTYLPNHFRLIARLWEPALILGTLNLSKLMNKEKLNL
jgi:glycosyltransferase involved in cell wall biosynthesis